MRHSSQYYILLMKEVVTDRNRLLPKIGFSSTNSRNELKKRQVEQYFGFVWHIWWFFKVVFYSISLIWISLKNLRVYAKNFTKKNTEKPCSQLASLSISLQNFQKKNQILGTRTSIARIICQSAFITFSRYHFLTFLEDSIEVFLWDYKVNCF